MRTRRSGEEECKGREREELEKVTEEVGRGKEKMEG